MNTGWFICRVIWATALYFAAELASAVVYFGLPIVIGLATQAFFDVLSRRAPAGPNLWTVLALLLLLQLARSGAGASLELTVINLRYAASGLLRANLLRGLLRRPGALPLPDSSGEALSRFRDDAESIVFDAIDCWVDLIGRSVFAVIAFVVMIRIDAPLAVAVAAMMLVSVPVIVLAGDRIAIYGRLNHEAIGRVTGFLGEMFGGVQAIKAAGATGSVVAHLQRLGEQRRQTAVRDQIWQSVVNAVAANVVTFGTGLILLIAGQALRSGTFTVGDFSLFVVYLTDLIWFPDEIARWIISYRQAGVSIGRMAHLLGDGDPRGLVERDETWRRGDAASTKPACGTRRAPPTPAASPPRSPSSRAGEGEDNGKTREDVTANRGAAFGVPLPLGEGQGEGVPTFSPLQFGAGRPLSRTGRGVGGEAAPLLEARGLTVRHPSSGRGIQDVWLRLERGSFVVITGRIGAGKTTLLQALLGLLPHEEGEIYWKGKAVADPTAFFGPPWSSYVPQTPRLFSETLRANLEEGWSADGPELARVARLAALDEDLAGFPDGWETIIGPRGARLSGGQIQRAAAARAFLRAPELLVLDDLSSALDLPTEELLWERLAEWRRDAPNLTILAVSHRPAALHRADRVLWMEEGVLSEQIQE